MISDLLAHKIAELEKRLDAYDELLNKLLSLLQSIQVDLRDARAEGEFRKFDG